MFSHQDINEEANFSQNDETNPTIAGVAQTLARREGKVLDEKQYITYEMLCCTFLLQLVNETLDPTSSVHKQVGVSISMDEELFTGMMNIGVRPTVDGKKRVIEVNIFDFNRDIYGKKLVIRLEKFLRGEVKFNGLDELKAQLNADRTQAQQVFMP